MKKLMMVALPILMGLAGCEEADTHCEDRPPLHEIPQTLGAGTVGVPYSSYPGYPLGDRLSWSRMVPVDSMRFELFGFRIVDTLDGFYVKGNPNVAGSWKFSLRKTENSYDCPNRSIEWDVYIKVFAN